MTGRTGKRKVPGSALVPDSYLPALITGMSMSAWAQEAGTVKGADQDIVVLYNQ